MPILRRTDQVEEAAMPGLMRLTMTGPSTGANMLTVARLTAQPGAEVGYHIHPNTEESIFLLDGDVEFHLDGHRFGITSGDCVVAARGTGHGFANTSHRPAVLITMYPTSSPVREARDLPDLIEGPPGQGVSFRSKAEPYEFMPGITRFDMAGDFVGAESTYLSELIFEPGAVAANHYHPTTEESMYCLRGKLEAVYGDNDDIPMDTGDMFTCEPSVRHGIFNSSNAPGTLLAIHPVTKPERVEVP